MTLRTFRELGPEDFDRVFAIANLAYPPYGDRKEKREIYIRGALATRSSGTFYGCFDPDGSLAGFMEVYDFEANLRYALTRAGGLGFVAADPVKKRQGIASDLINRFLEICRQKGYPLAVLYPFNIGFYRKKGFACTARMHQFCVKPAVLPYFGSRDGVSFINADEKDNLAHCFRTYFERTNGMLMKRNLDIDNLFDRHIIAAYKNNGVIEGYLAFNYQKTRPDLEHSDDMAIDEWVCNTREAFAQLCSFLNTQSDQIHRLIINTPDDNLYLAALDPANGQTGAFKNMIHEMYVTAADSMSRVVDVRRAFEVLKDRPFGNACFTVRFIIAGASTADAAEDVTVAFTGGMAKVDAGARADVEVRMDISAFTAMFCSSVSFDELYRMRSADISDEAFVGAVSDAFRCADRPKTVTYF